MEEFKGTPGPWSVASRKAINQYGVKEYIIDGLTSSSIASVYAPKWGEEFEQPEYLKNANLVAAAPELLEALQTLVHYHLCEQEGISSGQPTSVQWMEAVDKGYEAINKALNKEA